MKLFLGLLVFLLFSCFTTNNFVKDSPRSEKASLSETILLPDTENKLMPYEESYVTETTHLIDADGNTVFVMPKKVSFDKDFYPIIDNSENNFKSKNILIGEESSKVEITETKGDKLTRKENGYNTTLKSDNDKISTNRKIQDIDNKKSVIVDESSNDKILLDDDGFTIENNISDYSEFMKTIETENITEGIEEKTLDLTNTSDKKSENIENIELEANENDEITISLSENGWIIKKIVPDLVKLLKREISGDNVIFVFKTGSAASVTITFVKSESNSIKIRNYNINIKARMIFKDSAKKETTKKVEKKQKQDKSKEDFRKTLGNELFNQKKYIEAKARYQTLIDEGKVDAEIYYKMGIIEKELSNGQASLDFFQKNIKEKDNPFFGSALTEVIGLLKSQKKYSEAIDIFYNYGMSDMISPSESEELYLLLSDIYFNMKDFVSSSNEYRRFIKNYPDSSSIDKALFYLAYSVENYNFNPDYKEAYRIYKLLTDNYPESRYIDKSRERMLQLERHYLKIN